MTGAPEFSRRIALDRIGTVASRHEIAAEADERTALAARFGLRAVQSLAAEVELVREDDDILATGAVSADIVQACVVTGEDVATHLEEPFELRLRARPAPGDPEQELEIEESDLDIVFHDGEAVDLGELAAETAMLALPLFPRSAGADEAAQEAGIVGEEEAGPFGALKELRDRLAGEE
ncbi:MAG: DUF177 domain-containing protein [Parasphingopyxis sp.]|nr:DUF177 domain-containing protein [Sphingomonadales bacterium]